jgi:sec-independent protein translocase protein TatB
MFNISSGEFVVLIVAALFILGPERLPGAAAWLGRTVRQVRDYAAGARKQLESELGPEFDELRKPLEDLRNIRNFDPKRAITKQLLDATGGYDPRDDLRIDLPGFNGSTGANGAKPNGFPAASSPAQQQPLAPGERPPFDPDAT